MNIAELIDKLIAIRDEHGDTAQVEYWNTNCCYGDYEEDVTDVEFHPSIGEGFVPSVLIS